MEQPRGRKQMFPEEVSFTVKMGKDQAEELKAALPLVIVAGARGKERPMTQAELVRECVRVGLDQLRRGRFKPRPLAERHAEHEIVRVLKPEEITDEASAAVPA